MMRIGHHLRTLGPRGAVGFNAAAVGAKLEMLSIMLEQAKTERCPLRFHTINSGEAWVEPCSRMGGKLRGSRSSLARLRA